MLQEEAAATSQAVANLPRKHLEKILDGQSLEDYHKAFVHAHSQSSLLHAAATAEMDVLLGIHSREVAAENLANASLDSQGDFATKQQTLCERLY